MQHWDLICIYKIKPIMSRLFYKTLVRNFWKNKSHSLLNMFGLSIGITCAALIFLWVENKYSYRDLHRPGTKTYPAIFEKYKRNIAHGKSGNHPIQIKPVIFCFTKPL
jgi:hypothetical protein